MVDDVVHYCVTNMPGAVGRTSTFALCNATLNYVMQIADRGVTECIRSSLPIASAANLINGQVTHQPVAATFGLDFIEPTHAAK
jgi:alanine dehydrogenase